MTIMENLSHFLYISFFWIDHFLFISFLWIDYWNLSSHILSDKNACIPRSLNNFSIPISHYFISHYSVAYSLNNLYTN